MKSWLPRPEVLLHSYSEILFLRSRLAGAVLLVVTLLHPNVGVAGIVSVVAAYLFSRLIGMGSRFLESGFFTYNALLVGLSVGYLFQLGPLSLFLATAAGIFSFVISVTLNGVFSVYLKLPILSLPFVLVSSITWLAAQGYGDVHLVGGAYSGVALTGSSFPLWLGGFFNALGAILFMPQPLAGLAIALVMLWASRLLFLLALGGYLLGAGLGALLGGSAVAAFGDINGFNYILIAMALGGVFLIPSPRSYLVAATGVAVATLLISAVRLFWAHYGIPVFTLPFNLVAMGFLYALGSVGYPLITRRLRATPEQNLDDYLGTSRRFGWPAREIALPLVGEWTVWQAFDGDWTHRDSWRYAYDFVIERDGASHQGGGSELTDYYAWGQPVVAPCRGRVIKVIADLHDNPPGHVDSQNNWGNLVIIESPLGWYVELSHFAQGSIGVKEGDWVEVGSPLGLCGNSGYSPQPHVHVQLQATAQVGAVTLPFRFKGYVEKGLFRPHGLPAEGATVEPLYPDRGLELRTAFPLESQLRYRLFENEQQTGELRLTVCMGEGGESRLDSGRGRLYFARDDYSFYFYRLEGSDPRLAGLFAALPRLPLVYRKDLHWQDTPPSSAVTSSRVAKLVFDLLRACCHRLGESDYRAHWEAAGVIRGTLRRAMGAKEEPLEVVLHPRLGFSSLQLGTRRLELVPPATSDARLPDHEPEKGRITSVGQRVDVHV